MDKIEANQELPYKLMKNKLLHGQQYKELLFIVNKNIPNISPKEIVELFKSLLTGGCTCAAFANSLVDQVYNNDEEFKAIFGFSLLTKNKIDCNKLMVDIYSKLYKLMKIKIIEYKNYRFNSIKEAALCILNKSCESDGEAALALFENGIMQNGKDQYGKLLFKSSAPKITNYVGSCNQVAKEYFGINDVNTKEELKSICAQRGIKVEYSDVEISQKLSGLTNDNFNFWSNYYLNFYNLDINIHKDGIAISDFKDDYDSFTKYINELVASGFSISISSGPNSIAYMHTKGKLSWSKISGERVGHVVIFKYFDENGDMIVSSYGEDYIIPKEYFSILEFSKSEILRKNENKNQKMSM